VKTFIIISIVLHIVTLFLIYFIYKRFQSLHELNLPDVKELLEQTLFAIKEENERLHENIKNTKPTVVAKDKNLEQQKHVEIQPERISITKNVENQNRNESSLLNHTVEDKYEPSLHGQILHLYEKGLTKEEIAQTLNCGKTEVELILRFQHNE